MKILGRFSKLSIVPAVVLLTIVLLACTSAGTEVAARPENPAETPSRDQLLILSDITKDPAAKIEAYQPMADYLGARLTDYGIKAGKVVTAPDMSTMIQYLKAGQVDLFFDSPYPAFIAHDEADAIPLLRRWKKGVAEYHTVIVAGKETGLKNASDLLGHMVAFDDPVSTSGFLLPKGFLTNLGFEVAEKASASSPVASDQIGYVFAGGEDNVRAWVLQGKTAAAAMPSQDYEGLPDQEKGQLQVIARTSSVPRHIALARPGMDEKLRGRIVELLLSMDQSPEGQAVLATFERTKKFDSFPNGVVGTMDSLEALFQPES